MLQELRVGDFVDFIQPPVSRAVAAEIPRRWHIVISEPQREDATVQRLRAAAFRCYAPIVVRQIKAGRGRTREIRAAMFPSYLFVALPIGAEWWGEVRTTRGVHDFLSIDGKMAILPAAAIDAIRDKEAALEARRQNRLASTGGSLYQIGQQVLVTVGPFEKLLATIERIDARGRVEVLLAAALLGRRQCAVDSSHLQALS